MSLSYGAVSYVQDTECILFYRYIRSLKGYMIAGLFVGTSMKAKLQFAKIWKYFINEVVQKDDIYCSILLNEQSNLFKDNISYHSELDGISIYKVDNYLQKI